MHPDRAGFSLRQLLRSPALSSRWRALKALAEFGEVPAHGSGAHGDTVHPRGGGGDPGASPLLMLAPSLGGASAPAPTVATGRRATAGAIITSYADTPSKDAAVSVSSVSVSTAGGGAGGAGPESQLDLMYSMAGVSPGAREKRRSRRYGRVHHPGNLPVRHYPPVRERVDGCRHVRLCRRGVRVMHMPGYVCRCCNIGHRCRLTAVQENQDEAMALVPVFEQRYLSPPHLPTLNKWQHRKCAECNAEQSTGVCTILIIVAAFLHSLVCTQ